MIGHRTRKVARGAIVVALVAALVGGASPAVAADGWGSYSNADLMKLHADIGCETRLLYPGRFTPCTGAMWDEYLDLVNEMKRRNLPIAKQYPTVETFERTGDSWDPLDFEDMTDDFPVDDYPDYGEGVDPAEELDYFDEKSKKKNTNSNPFKPSTSRPREFMINTLGSVLGEAMPDKWRAEQLANQHRYNHSWEGLRAQFGQDPANPNYVGRPDSYDDYVLRKHEMDQKGGTGGKKNAAPATKASPFRKGLNMAGGALGALMGYPFATAIGNGVTNMVGIDSQGVVCGSVGDDVGGDLVAFITGNDCSGWNDFVPTFNPNQDVAPDIGWGDLCTTAGYCLHYEGVFVVVTKGASAWRTHQLLCFSESGGTYPSAPAQLYVDWPAAPAGVPNDTYVTPKPGVRADTAQLPANIPSGTFTGCAAAGGTRAITAATGLNNSTGTEWPPRGMPTRIGWGTTAGESSAVWQDPDLTTGDPERYLECTILGDDGHEYTAQSAAYREGDGEFPAPNCPVLPDGVRPQNVKINDSEGQGMYDEDVTDAYAEWWDEYPECRTGACKLDLIRVSGSYPVSCFDLENECAEWFSDPEKADNYECHYGIHTVDLDECNVYSGLFVKGRIEIGAPYADPLTGEWSGGQSSPEAAAEEMNTAVQDPDSYRTCLAAGWAQFNPVEWILSPVKCALEWAFVPRQTVMNLEGFQMSRSWEETPVGQVVAAVGEWNLAPSASGCKRTVDYPNVVGGDTVEVVLWDACEGPMATVATISRVVTSATLVGLAVIVFRRSIGGAVDFKGN